MANRQQGRLRPDGAHASEVSRDGPLPPTQLGLRPRGGAMMVDRAGPPGTVVVALSSGLGTPGGVSGRGGAPPGVGIAEGRARNVDLFLVVVVLLFFCSPAGGGAVLVFLLISLARAPPVFSSLAGGQSVSSCLSRAAFLCVEAPTAKTFPFHPFRCRVSGRQPSSSGESCCLAPPAAARPRSSELPPRPPGRHSYASQV